MRWYCFKIPLLSRAFTLYDNASQYGESTLRTAYISHSACLKHDTGEGHPENAAATVGDRGSFIQTGLSDVLRHFDAPQATEEQLLRVHTRSHLEAVESIGARQRLRPPGSGYGDQPGYA